MFPKPNLEQLIIQLQEAHADIDPDTISRLIEHALTLNMSPSQLISQFKEEHAKDPVISDEVVIATVVQHIKDTAPVVGLAGVYQFFPAQAPAHAPQPVPGGAGIYMADLFPNLPAFADIAEQLPPMVRQLGVVPAAPAHSPEEMEIDTQEYSPF